MPNSNSSASAEAVTAGTVASSTALIGFGIDSVIEVSSAAAVAWQFAARDPDVREAREHTALRITAVSFFALAAYLLVECLRALTGSSQAQHSTVGIVLAAVSLLVMPCVSIAQRRAGRRLGSASAVADSNQTLLCTYLSAVVLTGLLANSLLGWSWADPIASLVIARSPSAKESKPGAATPAARFPPASSTAPPPPHPATVAESPTSGRPDAAPVTTEPSAARQWRLAELPESP